MPFRADSSMLRHSSTGMDCSLTNVRVPSPSDGPEPYPARLRAAQSRFLAGVRAANLAAAHVSGRLRRSKRRFSVQSLEAAGPAGPRTPGLA